MLARRLLFALLVLATISALLLLMALALSPGGLDPLDWVILVLFAITLPWMVIGFWNAAIGFLLMHFSSDPVAAACPAAMPAGDGAPMASSTAIMLCIRNEVPARVIRNIEPTLEALVRAGFGKNFHLYVLSDTDNPHIAAAEEQGVNALSRRLNGRLAVTYRRRARNTGFKAGNIRDFCERWGENHEFAVTLDADSVMTADAILRLVRVIEREPRLGILQALVVGLPSTSAFARLFQFGMRLGMRSYTIGSAWWQGDCGPYWGHNAILRLAPFRAFCVLPQVPGEGILSHDQIEAVLMRRAGYDVRVLPEEDLGWEENPTTLVEFMRRDLRWCRGNMQYWRFLTMPGLKLVSRYQLAFAILMFLGSPAWIGLMVCGTAAIAFSSSPSDVLRFDAGLAVFASVLAMWFAPQLATTVDVLLRPNLRRAFGGGLRFVGGFLVQMLFFLLLSSIMWFGHTLFLLKLVFGGSIGWLGQIRDDHSVPFAVALQNFWPHTAFGCAILIVLALTHPFAIPFVFVFCGGLVLSIPLAVLTGLPRVGRTLVRVGLGRLPEETAPPDVLRSLRVPALELLAAAS